MAALKSSLFDQKNLYDYVDKERTDKNRLGPSSKSLLTAIVRKAYLNIS
jgi:hypothetical protein